MSTKICEGYRTDIKKLNEVIDFVRNRVYELARSHIKITFVDNILDDCDVEEIITRVVEISKYMGFLDYGLNIWIQNDYCYIIPVASCNIYEDIFPEFVEDFSYWDCTDKPDGISYSEWDMRAIAWKSINCGTGTASHNARRLYCSVINMASGRDMEFEYEIRKIFLEKYI